MSRKQADQRYVGVGKEINHGMIDAGKIIHDARVLGLIPKIGTGEGWLAQRGEDVRMQSRSLRRQYGLRVSAFAPEPRLRFRRIQSAATQRTRQTGCGRERVGDGG
jgi:hypothetical protein